MKQTKDRLSSLIITSHSYFYAAPPTYEESVFGIVEFQDEEENEPLRYTPMYTFYNWEQLTPTRFLSQTSLNRTDEIYDGNNDGNTLQVSLQRCLFPIEMYVP